MYRECRSCGSEIKQNICKKCGYNNTKKAPTTEPEYKPNKEIVLHRAKKVKTYQIIILMVVVLAAVIFAVLYSTGAIFNSNDNYKEKIDGYFNAIDEGDFDAYISFMTKEDAQDYEDDLKATGLSKKEYMEKLYSDFTEEFGEDYSISLNYITDSNVNRSDLSIFEGEYLEVYGKEIKVLSGRLVGIEVVVQGSKDSDTINMNAYVCKIKRDWYIVNVENK